MRKWITFHFLMKNELIQGKHYTRKLEFILQNKVISHLRNIIHIDTKSLYTLIM
jgi:hypothetical protein